MAEAALRTGPDSMPAKKAARFPREARLLRHKDFERVYKQGRRHFSASMTVFYWPRPEAALDERVGGRAKKTPAKTPALLGLRGGFTVGRGLGGGGARNRIK